MRIQERGVSKGNEKFYEPSKCCENSNRRVEGQVVFALCSSAQEESRSRGRRCIQIQLITDAFANTADNRSNVAMRLR